MTRIDYHPQQVPEAANQPPSPQPVKLVWALRIGGILLAVLTWGIASLHSLTLQHILVNTLAFGALAVCAMAAASARMRLSVNSEKKLRLDLLVHNMQLESMAARDGLTRLFNRRYFFDKLEHELETARAAERPLSVLLIDIDQLQAVNNTYGYKTGDEILKRFGDFLLGQTRASDVPARIGGNEFALILLDTSEAAARLMVNRIQKALESTNLMDEAEVTLRVTAAAGASGFPWGGDTVDLIMTLAEASLRTDKQARRQAATTPAPEPVPSQIPAIYQKTEERAL